MAGSRVAVVVAVVAAVTAGCMGDGSGEGKVDTATRSETGAVQIALDETERESYVTAYVVCHGSLAKLAQTYGTVTVPEIVAKEHARFFVGDGAIGAYHGCLDGVNDLPNKGWLGK